MKRHTVMIIAGAAVMIVLLVVVVRRQTSDGGIMFSTHLYPKFQAKGCTNCHDFFEKRLEGLSFTTHRERSTEKCVECHDREVTGFANADEWFARPGLYTSDMNAQQTCETIKRELHVQFKHKGKAARDMAAHLFESPRVLWGIAGATPNSGRLPKETIETDLVQGGMEQWRVEVNAWIQSGMVCN